MHAYHREEIDKDMDSLDMAAPSEIHHQDYTFD